VTPVEGGEGTGRRWRGQGRGGPQFTFLATPLLQCTVIIHLWAPGVIACPSRNKAEIMRCVEIYGGTQRPTYTLYSQHNTYPNSFHTELRWGSGCDNTIPPNSFHTELHWGNCCAIGLASLKSRFRTEKYTCLLCPMSIQMYTYINMLVPLCVDVKKTDAQLVTCSLSTQQSTVSVVSVRTTSTAM